MKYLILLLATSVASADRLENAYLPPNSKEASASSGANAGLLTPLAPGQQQNFAGLRSNEISVSGSSSSGFSSSGGSSSGGSSSGGSSSGFSRSGGSSSGGSSSGSLLLSSGRSSGGSSSGGTNSGGSRSGGSSSGGSISGGSSSSGSSSSGKLLLSTGSRSSGSSSGGRLPLGSGSSNAELLKYINEMAEDSYYYAYEISDGTKVEQQGRVFPGAKPEEGTLQVSGSYSYIGDDGQTYSVTYTADENGYHAEGAHLPTPPPIPEAILRSLQLTDTSRTRQYDSPKSSYDADAEQAK